MADAAAAGVRFAEAIEFLRRKLNISSAEWREIWAQSGGIAKEAADQASDSMMRDLLKAVLKAIEDGTTLEQFRADYDRIVEEAGWTAAGEPGWHTRLVFRLHTGNAYAAGRWEQAERLQAVNPARKLFFRYVTVGDHRVRPHHRAWQGVVLPIDHPFWATHYPPNGFNCRCHVQVVSERDIARYGWTVTADDDRRLAIPPDQGWSGNVGLAGTRLTALVTAR